MPQRPPKAQRLAFAWFGGVAKAVLITTLIAIPTWVLSVETRLTAHASGIQNNHDLIIHDYTEIISDLSDIKQTVHDLRDSK